MMFQKSKKMPIVVKLGIFPWRKFLENAVGSISFCYLLACLRLRPLALFFLALFVFWIYKTRCNFQIKLKGNSKRKLERLRKMMDNCEKKYQGLPFIIIATLFICVIIVERFDMLILIFGPSVLIVFVSIVTVIRECLEIKKVDETEAGLRNGTMKNNSDDDEEFVPETNKINMAILENASEITSPTEDIDDNDDDPSDDIPSELLIPDSIPEINENSTDEDDDELIPVVDVEKPIAESNLTISSKIHFKKGHFKNDTNQESLSSSSSEESLSKGLRFPEHTVVDGATKRDQISDTLDRATVSNVISNQLSNIFGGFTIKWLTGAGAAATTTAAAAKTVTSKEKDIALQSDRSDDSEFEILDHE